MTVKGNMHILTKCKGKFTRRCSLREEVTYCYPRYCLGFLIQSEQLAVWES